MSRLSHSRLALRSTVALSILGISVSAPEVEAETVLSVTQITYDGLDRVQCSAVRMNPAVFGSLPASACSLGTQGSQGPDRITEYIYDANGNVAQARSAVGTALERATETSAYSANGKKTDLVDAVGNHSQFVYDGFDRQTQWIFPSKTLATAFNSSSLSTALSTAGAPNTSDFEQYGYDANNNRTYLRKRDGRTLTYTYDGLNRVKSKCVTTSTCVAPNDATGRDVYYSYDLLGRQLSATFDSASGAAKITNTYDDLGRLTSSSSTMDGTARTMSSQYDAAGNRTMLTGNIASYSAPFSYDALGRMTAYVGEVQIAYDNSGRRSSLNFGSSGTTSSATYGYDPLDRLTSLTHDLAGTAADQSLTYGYNPASQISARTASNDSYAYGGLASVNRAYMSNGLNQYTAAGGASFAYDANGNLTSDGSNTFAYDAENRLVSVTGAHTATLSYDPLGRLWQISAPSGTTRFIYDGDHDVVETDGSGNSLRAFDWGPGADEPLVWWEGSGPKMLYADERGSVISAADSNGNVVATNTYDEYGIPGSANSGRFQFTGQAWLSELGFYYYKARMYSPTLGRFLQTDPVGYKDQINLYEYVGDEPIDGTDPTGEFLWPWEHPLSVAIGVGPAGRATAAQQAHYIQVFNRDFATSRGRELLKQIIGPWWRHGSPVTVVLKPGIAADTGAVADRNGNPTGTIEIDPNFHPQVRTASGNVIASDERIAGHELGHAVTGTGDTGKNQMDNVKQNENPIVQDLGLSPRTQYSAPVQDPNAKREVPKQCNSQASSC